MVVVLHVQLQISIYLGKKVRNWCLRLLDRCFKSKSLQVPEWALVWVSYYAIKCGRRFGSKAKAVNTCGSWSSAQQLLQMSYWFSVPCCIWVWAVISWPKPRCQQTLQEELSPASVELHKSFPEIYQERGSGAVASLLSAALMSSTFSRAGGEDAHLCHLPWTWHHLRPPKRSILGLTQKKLPCTSCLSQDHRPYGWENTRSSDSEGQRYDYTDIVLIKQHPLRLRLQLMDAAVAAFKNVSHLFLGMPVRKTSLRIYKGEVNVQHVVMIVEYHR